MVHESGAVLSFHGSDFARNTKLTVQFSTANLTNTLPDALLKLKFRRAPSDVGLVHVLLAVNGSDALAAEERSTDPSKSDNEVSWPLDMDVLAKTEEVQLVLTIIHRSFFTLHADYFRLEVQPSGEEVQEVYSDTMTAVRGVTLSSGGLAGGMTLYRPDNRASWHDVHAVSVLKKVSWSEDFEEIFRLDKQGMMWLKPRSAYASASPPYGTAVVVGPADPRASEAAAPISRVDIDPWALKFTLTYVDSSVSEVSVRSGSFGVRAIVTHKRWSSVARAWPVAVVTSMWVADGKADVDHVSANGAEPRGVLSGWRRLFGTSFAFFRQCVSRHNTQAPDITLELREPHPDLHVDYDSFS